MAASLQVFAQTLERIRALADLSAPELRIVQTATIVIALLLIRWVILFVVSRQTADARVRYHWRKGVTYVVATLGIFLVARVWFTWLGSLATFLGLLSAGLAVALREPVQDVAGWLFLMWRRPFVVGDRIEIEGQSGDVIDVRLFQFTMLEVGNWVGADQSTGRIIHVPNGKIFSNAVANYTRGFPYIWNELAIVVTFESDWEAAKDVLLGIATRHGEQLNQEAEERILRASRRFMIFYSTLSPTVYTSVVGHGVQLTIRYLCEARRRRGTAQAIWEDVLRAFAARDDVAFAYPTQRFFDQTREGKTAPRPDAVGEAREP
jgi:small-conductance mechanosensitive channel